MHRPTSALAFCLLATLTLDAAPPAHPVVPGFERFFTGEKADLTRGGQLLLNDLNCVNCHTSTTTSVLRRQAPVLDSVGTRVRLSHLRKFLRDPQAVKPGTTMPALFAGDPQRDAKVEALVHFLSSTGTLRQERADRKGIAPGRDLYHKAGCVACHGSRDAIGNGDKVLPTSVPLGDLKAKYSLAGLSAFLSDPHQVRPSGRMPRLLQGKEAKDVANYLLQGIKVDLPSGRGSTTYAYFEGSWDRVPDFDRLKAKATGTAAGFDLGVARRGNDYGVKFEGYVKLERAGDYTFALHSDDGSRLWIDGKLTVTNDGVHPPTTVSGKAKLTKGVHKVTVGFMQAGGGAELSLHVDGPGLGNVDVGDLVAATEAGLDRKPVVKETSEDLLEFKPELIRQGRELFASTGCASCHQLREGQKPIASTLSAAPLRKLKGNHGCLSAAPARGLPYFALSEVQKSALTKAVASGPATDTSPAAVIARTFTAFNCYACHARDRIGGPEEELNRFFQTTQPEMGDEGRLPPALDGVGAKVTLDYLKNLLDRGTHDRPYMHTRMPGFGLSNVSPLVEALTKFDKLPELKPIKLSVSPLRVKTVGRHLVGGEAFGCIKCHTFNGQKAEGVQGIDMTLLPRKLRHDWFHAYINDPQKFRPGTRMPSAFLDGKSSLPKVILDGTAPTQIEAMWVYLQDGNKARLPFGVGKKSIPLVPTTGAIIYRNFIEGSGTRAIAVGYPEKAHLCFDANELRLTLLWRGAFIDAAKHWTDRGAGFEGPLGDDIVHMHAGVPFAILSRADAAWPNGPAKGQGYRFLGYRLTPDDRPTFHYSFGEMRIEDFPNPVNGKEVTLRRQLDLKAPKPMDNVYYRAAAGSKIEALENGWFKVDGVLRLKVDSPGAARVRQAGGKAELLVPVQFTEGKARIVLEYAW